VKKYLYNILLG